MNSRLALFTLLFGWLIGSAFGAAPKGLSSAQIKGFMDSFKLDAQTRTAINAVSNNDLRELALNREIVAVKDDIFSLRIPTEGNTDQESTGRCWMFAGMNLLRQEMIDKYELDEFELSQSYLAFWDKLEKANVFFEFFIENADRDLLDREVSFMLDYPIGDGGYWSYVIYLVEKYGVLPKKFMGETHSSAKTRRMNYILNTMLRRDALILRKLAAYGKTEAQLQNEKMKMLEDVFHVLVVNYGKPPTEFVWRTVDEDGVASEPVTYTPQKFYKEMFDANLSEFVSLADYPLHPTGKRYSINLTKSMADKPDNSFVNLKTEEIKAYTLKALQDSQRVWFGCDMGHDVHSKKGLMAKGLYDYEALFEIDLSMTKTERLQCHNSSNNHAMVIIGVDLVDGKPQKWWVENSWGTDRGDNGFFTMTDDWFDEYVYDVVLPKKYLERDVRAMLKEKPIPLPVWDPVWRHAGR